MKKSWKAVLAAAVGVTVLSGVALAVAPPVAGFFEDRPLLKCFADNTARVFNLLRGLDLNSEQKAQVAAVLKANKKEISSVLHRLNDEHRKVVEAVRAENPNEGAIRAAAAGLGQAIADGAVLRAKVRREVQPILTPAQRQKIDATIGECQAAVDKALQDFDAK
jgi:Spy/CpxP family protein refolding chaperone